MFISLVNEKIMDLRSMRRVPFQTKLLNPLLNKDFFEVTCERAHFHSKVGAGRGRVNPPPKSDLFTP